MVRRRTITSAAGHALEILGHAIDYLADELVRENGLIFEDGGRLQTIHLLMAPNCEIYFACPVSLTFGELMHEM